MAEPLCFSTGRIIRLTSQSIRLNLTFHAFLFPDLISIMFHCSDILLYSAMLKLILLYSFLIITIVCTIFIFTESYNPYFHCLKKKEEEDLLWICNSQVSRSNIFLIIHLKKNVNDNSTFKLLIKYRDAGWRRSATGSQSDEAEKLKCAFRNRSHERGRHQARRYCSTRAPVNLCQQTSQIPLTVMLLASRNS